MQQSVIDDRYTVVELLGSGGMAQVYLAHDEVLDRDVALKILRGPYAEDEEFVGRFRQEARSAAGLSHPNIVSVYDQGRSEDGAYYMAMEYVPRGTLKDRIQRDGALAPDAAVGVALQIADALQAAHEKGVIHRDIKPQNVLVTHMGDVKVTDFGIARAASATKVTRTGHVLGTAGYMSPEQAKGDTVGPQSDLYSLGVVLYEMLTGNLPYEADSALGQAMKHIIEPPPSPREANPEVSEALDALTRKLLAKNPEDRCSSAAALADELERVRSGVLAVAGTEPEAMTEPLPPSPRGRTRRAAVQPPVAAPARAPERGGQRWGRLFSALAALLLAGTVLGGLIWALHSFGLLGSEASKNQADAEDASPTVQVPDLYWSATAESDLANVGLALGDRNVETSEAVPANVVIRSAPEEGDEVERDTIVDIWVSTGPVRPPTQVPSDPQPPPTQPPPAQPQPAQPPQPQFVQPAQPQTRGDDGEKEAQDKVNNKQKGNAKQKGDEGD
jgi:eukaryotic-like serine/threonine-protein kinase